MNTVDFLWGAYSSKKGFISKNKKRFLLRISS